MLTPAYEWTFRRVAWATLVLLSVGLCFWLLYRFYQVVFILFIAIVFGTVIRPVVDWLYARRVPRVVGGIIVYLFILALLTGFVLLLVPLISEQSAKIATSIPGYYQGLRGWMMGNSNPWIEQLSEFLPADLSILGQTQPSGQQIMNSAGQALGYVALAGNIFFTITAIILLAFYWTIYGPRAIQSLMLMVPSGQREGVRDLVSAIETKVGAYIAEQPSRP